MLEALYNKVVRLKACNFVLKGLQHRCFPDFFKNSLFYRALAVAISVCSYLI